ncbi:BppU family phage baseplate upper protein, partial [Weissella oryzae]|uniref:BppU family phage baseplate upper protein n=1 Tax=Weissella oryzae TaxID=1129792 RepID=UPI0004861E42
MTKILINLDVSKTPTITPVLRQRRADQTAYTADVSITRNGAAFDLTDFAISFEGITNKGAKIIDDSGIVITDAVNGRFIYSMPAEALNDVGDFKSAYFSLTKGSERETTNNFGLFVLASADLTEDESKNYLSEYEKMLEKLRELYESMNIDEIKKDIDELKGEMNETKEDINKQLEDTKTEIQAMIDEVTKTIANKDIAVRGEDNHFTANMIVDKPIDGSLKTRVTTVTDFADIAKAITTYPGQWANNGKNIANAPFASGNYT